MNSLNKYCYFNIEKIVQVFYYIQKYSDTKSVLNLMKYLFFSDRIHLREHYSLISLDKYVALVNGPAASNSLDVLNKKNEYLSNFEHDDLKYLNNIKKCYKAERIILEIGTDLLSKNEMSSLDKAIEIFSGKELVEISHDYPEWKRYKNQFEEQVASSKTSKSIKIEMEDFFKNPDMKDSPAINKYFEGVDPLYKDNEYLDEARQFYLESLGQHGS
ncbi:MAG: Panacea domain-containing protein [Treponema sp.]|nr:Panacea domain-containing protein [Treponema sp.]